MIKTFMDFSNFYFTTTSVFVQENGKDFKQGYN